MSGGSLVLLVDKSADILVRRGERQKAKKQRQSSHQSDQGRRLADLGWFEDEDTVAQSAMEIVTLLQRFRSK